MHAMALEQLGGRCAHCQMQRENLRDRPRFTGVTRDGGFATATVAAARFALPLGEAGRDESLAPFALRGPDRLARAGHCR